MKIITLGCHSASPRHMARTTAQLLEMRGHLFLIDCGEGTQMVLRSCGAKFSRIKHIFISHLHGDHFFGLPGLISTFQLLGREADLHIHAPKGTKEVILLLLKLSGAWSSFQIIFHELESTESQIIFEDDKLMIKTIPLDHRIYANGFLFTEKEGERRLNIDAVQTLEIDKCYFQNIKSGKDVTLDDGTVIPNAQLSFSPIRPQSYAFCSDTAFRPEIIPVIENVRVLYHESTFLQTHTDLAAKTKHSTARQAAQIAEMASAEALILGHYSSRYSDKNLFKKEAEEVFPNVFLSEDGKEFNFDN